MFGLRNRRRRRRGSQAREESVRRTVADLAPAERASVLGLTSKVPGELNKLMALGVLPGASLTLLQRSPSYVLKVGETVLAIDEKIAQSILVGPPVEA